MVDPAVGSLGAVSPGAIWRVRLSSASWISRVEASTGGSTGSSLTSLAVKSAASVKPMLASVTPIPASSTFSPWQQRRGRTTRAQATSA